MQQNSILTVFLSAVTHSQGLFSPKRGRGHFGEHDMMLKCSDPCWVCSFLIQKIAAELLHTTCT